MSKEVNFVMLIFSIKYFSFEPFYFIHVIYVKCVGFFFGCIFHIYLRKTYRDNGRVFYIALRINDEYSGGQHKDKFGKEAVHFEVFLVGKKEIDKIVILFCRCPREKTWKK